MDEYLQLNRARWEALTAEHERSPFYDLSGFKAGGDRLRSIELQELGDVRGKSLLHLQCHFGLDTLAWARRGAQVTGVDFAPQSIALAQSLSAELNIPAHFVCAEIAALPEVLHSQFEIVFTSYGVLHWLPDLRRWASVIAHFLQPGGIFYIVEDHPFFRTLRAAPDGELRPQRPYFFNPEPQRLEAQGSYATGDQGAPSVYYIWDHSLGEVLEALLSVGLVLEYLHEFPFAARAKFPMMVQGEDGWWRLPDERHGTIPFLFSLQARKPAHVR